MAFATQSDRSSLPTPLFAVVGATNLAVERVRDFDPKAFSEKAQELPVTAAARALQLASLGQARYDDLASRGKSVLDGIRSQASTEQLINQASNTVSRGKAAVTTARKAAEDTYAVILSTFGAGRTETEEVITSTRTRTQVAAKKTATTAKRSSGTARKSAGAAKTAAKGARTSARKTASSASKAASDAATRISK